MGITSRSKGWEIINSLWIIITFVIFVNWTVFFYIGARVKNRKWIFAGIMYLAVVVFYFMTHKHINDYAAPVFLVSWLASIVHAFIIRPKYLRLLDRKLGYLQGYNPMEIDSEHVKSILPIKLETIKKEVFNKINQSDSFNNDIVKELKPMIENYVERANELVIQKEKLEKILEQYSISELDRNISDLKSKLNSEGSERMIHEYKDAIAAHEKHRKAIIELNDQKEMIELRLDSTEMALKQIQYDLIKLESIDSHEEQKNFFKSFEDKSTELSEYLKILRNTYSNNELT